MAKAISKKVVEYLVEHCNPAPSAVRSARLLLFDAPPRWQYGVTVTGPGATSGISATVWVRRPDLERILAKAFGEQPSLSSPTLMKRIGYLRPEASDITWSVDDGNLLQVADSLRLLVDSHAHSFHREYGTDAALDEATKVDGWMPGVSRLCLRYAFLQVAGREHEAESMLEELRRVHQFNAKQVERVRDYIRSQ